MTPLRSVAVLFADDEPPVSKGQAFGHSIRVRYTLCRYTLNRLRWGWDAAWKSEKGGWLRHRDLGVWVAVPRFSHEDETDCDESPNHQNHEEKDLSPGRFLQMTVVSVSDHGG
jgi:hypothetical protein